MNTRINLQHASNSYSGDTMGRDSPSALLDMLAEVASQTLHSEKKRINSLLASQCKSKTANVKRKESCFTVSQLLSMPVSHLVKQFTIFTSDELKRQYSYTCALVPGCQQKYASFASEGKARTSIRKHLEEHLENFKADREAYNTFTAKSVNYKSVKTNMQNKKNRVQPAKKPQETLNKENKDVILEKSTNYLRKILLNDINIKEIEKQKCFPKSESNEAHNSELKSSEQTEFKVLGDHSYFERLDDKIPNRRGMSSLNNVLDNTVREENIVLMVVGTDTVHMEEYSNVNQKLSENAKRQDSDSNLYISELSWSDEGCSKYMETSATTKPKGKAKFIGTSKEEREMALAYMERIKKKGNPTGSNLQCRICDPPRTFTAPTTLVSHYRSHAGIKPYECRICRSVFTRRHSLKYHMLIHQNQTRFTCSDCGKKFRHPSHFREHQRRHTGEAPFGCDDCGQRFKTRNTYKRHLKTRHGKILTTTGELLHLPEEDFQKVRTNRRRKECAPEGALSADIFASDTIVSIRDQRDESQIVEEYVLRENNDDINRNWDTRGAMQVVEKCFEGFEVCSESQLNKTDVIETEIAIDYKYSERDASDIKMEYNSGDLLQLKSPFYDSEVINHEGTRVIYQHNYEDPSKAYNCNGAIQTYSEVDCKSETIKGENENVTKQEARVESVTYAQLETGQTEVAESTENNQITDDEKCIAQNDTVQEGYDEYANGLDGEKKEIYCTQIANASVSIIQAFDEIRKEIVSQTQDETLQRDNDERMDEDNSVVAETQNVEESNSSPNDCAEMSGEIDQQQNRPYLCFRSESLNGTVIAQNKCINIPLRHVNLYRDQQNQLKAKVNNCKKIRVLNRNMRAINVKQPDKPGAILLVSGDSLKNGILQIDRSAVVKSVKR